MSLEAEIARVIYEEAKYTAGEKRMVHLALRIPDVKRLWPGASDDQIIRAYVIVYEMLVQEIAEAIWKEKSKCDPSSAEKDGLLH